MVEGTATANSTIQVYINSTLEATTTSNGSGNWSTDITNQTDGDKNIEARVSTTPLVYFGSISQSMYVFDTETDTQITGSPFSPSQTLGLWAVNSTGTTAYAANVGTDSVLRIIDIDTNTVTTSTIAGAGLAQLVVSPDDSRVYISDASTNVIHVIDTSTNTQIDTLTLPGGETAAGLAISSDGSTIYAGSSGDAEVFVIDVANDTYQTISLTGPGGVLSVVLNNAEDRVYAAHAYSPSANVAVIDTETNTEITTVAVGSSPFDMAILPDDSKLYVANTQALPGTVSVVDTATNTVSSTVTVGTFTYGVDATPDGSKVYAVAAGNIFDTGQDGGAWMIDTSDDSTTRIFATDDGSIAPVAAGEFIVQQTASTSITAIVTSSSGSNGGSGELADTGHSHYAMFAIALTLLGSGVVLRRYQTTSTR
jgi:YVTN family beta-propeller protein